MTVASQKRKITKLKNGANIRTIEEIGQKAT